MTNRRRAAQGGSPATNYLMTAKSNPEVFAICLEQGWCSAEGMTVADAADITDIGTVFKGNRNIVQFDEFEYFGVSALSESAFSTCSSLVSISFPDTLNSIPYRALYYCGALTTVKFPDSLTIIRDNALEASHIVDINLPDIGEINYKALACAYAKTVTIGGQGATIKPYALNLPVLEWMKITTTNLSILGTNNIISSNAIIYVPDAQVNDYKAAANWSAYASQIKGLSEFVEPQAS